MNNESSKPESNTSIQPKKIEKEEADRLNNYAQNLNDKITHVVDYGGLLEESKRNKNNA